MSHRPNKRVSLKLVFGTDSSDKTEKHPCPMKRKRQSICFEMYSYTMITERTKEVGIKGERVSVFSKSVSNPPEWSTIFFNDRCKMSTIFFFSGVWGVCYVS